MASSPQFVATPRNPTGSVVNANGTNFQTIFTAGASGARIDSVFATNTDVANAYIVQVAVQKSGVDKPLGEVTIPAGAGTNGAAKSVALLNETDLPAIAYCESGALFLEAGCSLRVRTKSTVSGSNSVDFVGVAGDY